VSRFLSPSTSGVEDSAFNTSITFCSPDSALWRTRPMLSQVESVDKIMDILEMKANNVPVETPRYMQENAPTKYISAVPVKFVSSGFMPSAY